MKKISKEDIKKMKEKGKEWFEKNKNAIIFGAGCASSIVVLMISGKIFENKQAGISFGYVEKKDGSWRDEFGVETYGIDRFGRVNRGHIVLFNQEDADWIANAAHNVVKDINEHNGK